jgi:hypothetical protein
MHGIVEKYQRKRCKVKLFRNYSILGHTRFNMRYTRWNRFWRRRFITTTKLRQVVFIIYAGIWELEQISDTLNDKSFFEDSCRKPIWFCSEVDSGLVRNHCSNKKISAEPKPIMRIIRIACRLLLHVNRKR